MTARDWSDRVVLVTGSSSGIGAAVAQKFDGMGATVVVNSSSSVDAGEALASELSSAFYIQANVGEEPEASRLVEAVVERYGRLDVLVNNAGTTAVIPHHDLAQASVDVWRRIFEVNVFGTWAVTVAAVPALKEAQGAIINISSIAGLRPTGSSIPYASSKAALNHMTVLLAKVLGPEIRVNAVAPGLVDTPWTSDWKDLREAVRLMAPLRRTATPDDIAQVVADLAGSAYVTGQVVAVDGGMTLVL